MTCVAETLAWKLTESESETLAEVNFWLDVKLGTQPQILIQKNFKSL